MFRNCNVRSVTLFLMLWKPFRNLYSTNIKIVGQHSNSTEECLLAQHAETVFGEMAMVLSCNVSVAI
jgi:hypothetical protein